MLTLLRSWRALLGRGRRERELDAERRFHLEMQAREHTRHGASAAAAAAARRELGPLDRVREECRDLWGGRRLEAGWQDVRYAVRTARRRPGLTLTVALTLALGIGANTAIFSALDAVVLQPLPYADPDRLVMIWDEHPERSLTRVGPSPGTMLDWRDETSLFAAVAAFYAGDSRTLQEGAPEQLQVGQVTADFFAVLGRSPIAGRVFTADEVAVEAPVVVISHAVWQRRFGGRTDIIDQPIQLDGVPHRVVGVMPPDFALPNREVGLWLPWDFSRSYAHLPAVPRDHRFLRVVARLAPDLSLTQAEAGLATVSTRLGREHPSTNAGWRARLTPLAHEIAGDLRLVLLVLTGAVGFVLLIACTNVANLLLARASERDREMTALRCD